MANKKVSSKIIKGKKKITSKKINAKIKSAKVLGTLKSKITLKKATPKTKTKIKKAISNIRPKVKRAKVNRKKSLKQIVKKSVNKKVVSKLLLFHDAKIDLSNGVKQNLDKQILEHISASELDIASSENFSIPQDNNKEKIVINSKQTDIKICEFTRQSPHVIDLKKRVLIENEKEQDKNTEHKWEEKFANLDLRAENMKANFVTRESIKRSRLLIENAPGKFRRSSILFWSRINLELENFISGFSNWGEKRANSYLTKVAGSKAEVESQTKNIIVDKEVEISTNRQQIKLNSWSIYLPKREALISLSLFLVLSLSVTLPLKAVTFYYDMQENKSQVLGVSTTAFQDLTAGLSSFQNFDFESAGRNFSSANKGLLNIKDVLDEYPSFLVSLSGKLPRIGGEVTTGQALLNTGNRLSQVGVEISDMLSYLINNNGSEVTDKLIYLKYSLRQVNSLLVAADDDLSVVEIEYVPAEYQEKIVWLKSWLPKISSLISQAVEMADLGSEFLGHHRPQRYLLVFQNSNELRPTGGFMGTVAEANFDQGELINLYIPPGGVYDMQGSLKVLLESPKPLHLLNANWQLQDANWFFDFPTSARKILWFYEKSGGPTMDGVIAINSTMLPELLKLTGSIYLSNFDLIIDADNVIAVLQEEIEINYDKEKNQPKKIISELAPLLMEKMQLIDAGQFWKVFSIFSNALHNRDIQIYHQDENLQQKIQELGWAGNVVKTKGDYLAVVNTNIGGGKTDSYIKQYYNLQTSINDNGEIVNNLKITKEHMGTVGDYFSGNENIDYLRVYVPQGSQLLSADGFWRPLPNEFSSPSEGFKADNYLQAVESSPVIDEVSGTRITQEFDKTVFGNWVRLKPGEKAEISFTYILPDKLEFNNNSKTSVITQYFDQVVNWLGLQLDNWQEVSVYTMRWQKQSGQNSPSISHRIDLPDGWQVLSSPSLEDKIGEQAGMVYYQDLLENDSFWGVILSK